MSEISEIEIKSMTKEQKPCDDWCDVPSDKMTLEQARQAVKDLRKKWAECLGQELKIKVLDRNEAMRKLGAVDVYQARAWITLLDDLEYLGLKICEVEKMTLIDGDRIVTAQLYDDEHEEFTEEKMSIINYVNAYTDEGVITADDVLDKIRAEIEWLRLHKAQFLTSDNKVCIDSQAVLDILDKYKAESEEV